MPHPARMPAGADPNPIPPYRRRLAQALALLCGGAEPPAELIGRWLAGDEPRDAPDGEADLQDWAASHAALDWMMGITTIEAAEALAGEPAEGRYEEDD